MENHFIAWWNVENLFDERDAPETRRPPDLKRKIQAELKNWTAEVLERKTTNLAQVIVQMNQGAGPDIMGVCEIENRYVLEKLFRKVVLPSRDYRLIHHDMGDNRGIDVAFVYDANKYSFDPASFFHHTVRKRYPTRELVQASLITARGNELILVGNHWPSRSGGQYESEPYRILAAETLSYFIYRIQEVKNKDVAIVVMGDFNDEPHSRSLTDYALSTMDRNKVVRGNNPYLYNLMWPLLGQRMASYVYNAQPIMLDQFLVSKGIARKSGRFDLKEDNVRIVRYEGMVSGIYHTPVRFGQETPDFNGYSDHLPISMILGER